MHVLGAADERRDVLLGQVAPVRGVQVLEDLAELSR